MTRHHVKRIIHRAAKDISPKVRAGQWGAVIASLLGAGLVILGLQHPFMAEMIALEIITLEIAMEASAALVGIFSALGAGIGSWWAAYRTSDKLHHPESHVAPAPQEGDPS